MSLLCGFLASAADAPAAGVVDAMAAALRVEARQEWESWSEPGVGVGSLKTPNDEGLESPSFFAADGGRHRLAMAGELFATAGELSHVDPADRAALGRALLAAFAAGRFEAARHLDGEFQLAFWNGAERRLTLVLDRFGSLPLYVGESPAGVAFAGGVRGVLMAPGISAEPDPEAIREAVSFGGFRLGDRTNVRGVKMLPAGSVTTLAAGGHETRRYVSWAEIPAARPGSVAERIEEARRLFGRSIARRLRGARRPGETLSGGLDSRAILAEAAPRVSSFTAITYGLPGCDDARYARRAAEAAMASAGVTWVFHPLYAGRDPDWLERRTALVAQTDGLLDLTDLMHLETLPLQARLLDVHLSGYVGDAVAGPTFNEVTTPEGVLAKLPYYGTELGLPWGEALERARGMVAALGGAPARFALFDHKLPQATNRWVTAWRPYVRVRKPFLDHALFDFFQGLPPAERGAGRLYERFLREAYPALFASIPNQKTGVPVLSSSARHQLARAGRYGARRLRAAAARLGVRLRPRERNYADDGRFWREPSARRRIEEMILRPESLSAAILGREKVARVVSAWFERLGAPTQVVGALYVFEAYHAGLSRHLAAARSRSLR